MIQLIIHKIFNLFANYFANHTIVWQKRSLGLITVEKYRKENKLVIKRDHKTLSGVNLDTFEPTSQLYWFPHLMDLFPQQPQHILSLGGGACVYPTHVIKKTQKITVDVVEFDQAVIEAAQKFFAIPQTPRLRLIHGDGREFVLHASKAEYDFIFVDVGITITGESPYYNNQFLDKQALNGYCSALKENGTLMFNIMTTLTHQDKQRVAKQLKLFNQQFPTQLTCQVTKGESEDTLQDVIYLLSKQSISITSLRKKLASQNNLAYSKDKYEYVLSTIFATH